MEKSGGEEIGGGKKEGRRGKKRKREFTSLHKRKLTEKIKTEQEFIYLFVKLVKLDLLS